ncbi:MAG: ribosome hibernation promoting factor [Gammaproteobacteria bacterium]
MDIQFTGHQTEITDALRNLTTSKLERIVRHFGKILRIHVTFSVENSNRHIAEANIYAPGADFHARAEDSDMYKAIDDLINKLDSQLRKHKEKSANH